MFACADTKQFIFVLAIQDADERTQVPVIWICLVLEALSLAIQTAALNHPYLLQDK